MNNDSGSNAPADAGQPAPNAATGSAASTGAVSELPLAAGPPPSGEGDSGAEDSGGGEPTVVERAAPGTDFTPLGTEAQRYACTDDADCVLTKWADGACCPRLCRTNLALNAEFSTQLEAKRGEACERACPVAKCTRPEADYAATCVNKSCIVMATPLQAPPSGLE